MVLQIEVAPAAQREIKKLPKDGQRRVIALIEGLADEPRPNGVEKITARPDLLRVRSGNFRVVYTVREEKLVIVLAARDRKDAYRDLGAIEKRIEAVEVSVAARGRVVPFRQR